VDSADRERNRRLVYIIAIYSLLLQFTGKAQPAGLALILQVLPSTLVGDPLPFMFENW
jgi:hypothetical protein